MSESDKKVDVIDGVTLVKGETVIGSSKKTDGTGFILKYGNIVEMEDGKVRQLPATTYEKLLQRYIDNEKDRLEAEKQAHTVKEEHKPVPDPKPERKPEPASKAEKKPEVKPEPEPEPDNEPHEEARETRPTEEQSDDEMTQKIIIKHRKKEEAEPETSENDESEDSIDDEYEDEDVKEVPKKKLNLVMFIMAAAAAAASVFITYEYLNYKYAFRASDKSAEKEPEVEVVKLKNDIQAGNVIKEDDLDKTYITEAEYDKYTKEPILNSDGSTEQNGAVLYSNADEITGKYAAENIKAGSVLKKDDVSDLSENDKVIKMNVDGTEVYVPVNVTTAGESKITIYAICTNTTSSGETSNTALKMSEFTLSGRELKDIVNGDGTSVLNQLIQEQKDSKSADSASASASPSAASGSDTN